MSPQSSCQGWSWRLQDTHSTEPGGNLMCPDSFWGEQVAPGRRLCLQAQLRAHWDVPVHEGCFWNDDDDDSGCGWQREEGGDYPNCTGTVRVDPERGGAASAVCVCVWSLVVWACDVCFVCVQVCAVWCGWVCECAVYMMCDVCSPMCVTVLGVLQQQCGMWVHVVLRGGMGHGVCVDVIQCMRCCVLYVCVRLRRSWLNSPTLFMLRTKDLWVHVEFFLLSSVSCGKNANFTKRTLSNIFSLRRPSSREGLMFPLVTVRERERETVFSRAVLFYFTVLLTHCYISLSYLLIEVYMTHTVKSQSTQILHADGF